ncbi:MAG: amino acid adenylation domain-containing protein, partial [Gammaproteobacteria bacterium]|nr:amino acid adenylation domain-containing protein [Gammaproteobacteria bacterium]
DLALQQFLRTQLPDYMVPVAFVSLDAMPLTPNGKLDHRQLPAPEALTSDHHYVAPRNAMEQTLASLWAEVLKRERVGIYDNFFALGGDSIISIQIIARANQAGIKLTPRQMFEHQCIAELATVADTVSTTQAEQGIVSGELPLTPIQHWFFDQQPPQPQHWNQSFLLEVHAPFAPQHLAQAVDHLCKHHDALRLRFTSHDAHGWQQYNDAVESHAVFSLFDLSDLPDAQHAQAITDACSALQASFDLQHGPVWRCALFQLGQQQSPRLFITCHHLVIDGVSWRILLDDLYQAYQACFQGQPVVLPAKTTAFKHWAQQLHDYAQSDALLAERDYWLTLHRPEAARLPLDVADDDLDRDRNTVASVQTTSLSLAAQHTEALLHRVPTAYRTQINDVLLSALAMTLCQWSGHDRVLVDLEGHGREPLFEELDLSRTVGWFTSIFPVLLHGREATDTDDGIAALLKANKEHLRAIPNKGIGFGVLRYLADNNDTAINNDDALPQANISFNYLGQVDVALSKDVPFTPAPEAKGPDHDPNSRRAHLIDVSAHIAGGKLHLHWSYSTHFHHAHTIETLAKDYLAQLQRLINHCTAEHAGGYTPSDFPLAHLDQTALDAIYARTPTLDDIYPLSPLQQGLMFHTLYAPNSGVYFHQFACTIEGAIDLNAFKRAWHLTVNRHASLRAAFIYDGLEQPLQLVQREVDVPLYTADWRDKSHEEQAAQLQVFLEEDISCGFDLKAPPLLRLALLQTDDESHYFVLSFHHLLMDGWSFSRFLPEVFVNYEALCKDKKPQLPYSRSYRDYIAWLQQRDHAGAESFWRNELDGFANPTELGTHKQVNATTQHHLYINHKTKLSEELTSDIKAFSQTHQLTLNTVVQGAWALLLQQYSQSSDVCFGITVAGRPTDLQGVESTIGLFINTLPLRVQLNSDTELVPWLSELQVHNSALREYDFTPLAQIQTWSDVTPGQKLFNTLMVFENYPVDNTIYQVNKELNAIPNTNERIKIKPFQLHEQTNYPLALQIAPGDRLIINYEFDEQHFDLKTIENIAMHFEQAFKQFVSKSSAKLGELDLLTEHEHQQLLVDWNNTSASYPDSSCIHQLIEKQCEESPNALAAIIENESLTYGELNARANQLAHYLRKQGVVADNLVGICLERSLDILVAILGTLKAGGAYVPIDPDYPQDRIMNTLQDASVKLLITKKDLLSSLPDLPTRVINRLGYKEIVLDTLWSEIAEYSTKNPENRTTPQNLAYVIYTSGSTAKPKGVLNQHGSLCNLVQSQICNFEITKDTRTLQFFSVAFDGSVWETFSTLVAGGTLCIANQNQRLSTEQIVEWMRSQHVTLATIPPSVLLSAGSKQTLPDLKTLISAGEACPPAITKQWAPYLRFINAYGPTENTICVSFAQCDGSETIPPIGRPIQNVTVYLLDTNLNPVPPGVIGELYVGGTGVARGYLGQPRLTAEKFLPNPFNSNPGARMYRTGDTARYLPDGNLEYHGRIDFQVKLRGFRIELGEIETVLRTHSDIREAAVLLQKDAPGEGRLHAYIVAEPGAHLPESHTLRSFIQTYLPHYMVPASFSEIEHIPLTKNGKLDRNALLSLKLNTNSTQFVAPRDSVEQALADILSEVLKVEQVGVHDNFFELGGHSLLATQVISKIQNQLNVELKLSVLFESPTVETVATYIKTVEQVKQDATDSTSVATEENYREIEF